MMNKILFKFIQYLNLKKKVNENNISIRSLYVLR